MKSKLFNRISALATAGLLASAIVALPGAAMAAEGGLPEANSLSGDTAVIYTANLRGDISLYPKVKAVVDAYKAATGKDPVLVDAGNFYQGSRYAATDQGETVAKAMREIGYDAVVPGKNDFSFGTGVFGYPMHAQDFIVARSLTENFDSTASLSKKDAEKAAIVATNVSGTVKGDGRIDKWNENHADDQRSAKRLEFGDETKSAIVTSGTTKVGIVGTTDPAVKNVAVSSSISGLEFGKDATAAATEAQSLKEGDTPKADIVVSVSNLPSVPEVEGADALINVAPAAFGSDITVGAVVFDSTNKQIAEQSKRIDLAGVTADGTTAAAIKTETDKVDNANDRAIAKSEINLSGENAVVRGGEAPIGDLYADAFVWYVKQDVDLKADIAAKGVADSNIIGIINGGNLTDTLHEGEIIENNSLRQTDFYPNALTIYYLTGAQLLEQFEANSQALPFSSKSSSACASLLQVSGMTYNVDVTKAFDAGAVITEGKWSKAASVKRVTAKVNGVAIDPAAMYALVGHDKLSKGIDAVNYIFAETKQGSTKNETTIPVNRVLISYLTAPASAGGLGGVIGKDSVYAASQGRITFNEIQEATQAPDTNVAVLATPAITMKVGKKATKSKVFQAKKLKAKKQTFTIKASATGGGKITFTLNKKAKKALKVSSKGKVTVKKGAKKGTYKITVKSAATQNYLEGTATFTVKVK